jgi:zinc D-Ala-D-Ala carboxypeptidase
MYKYFKLSEFDSPDQEGSGEMMEPSVIEALDVARDIAGFPFIVLSGFRSVAHNRKLLSDGYAASPKSSHLLGWAVDIAVPSSRKRFIMVEALLDAGFTRFGIGEDFIHVDMDPQKSPNVIWTY